MQNRIKSSNYQVISSGLVTSFDGAPIDISSRELNDFKYHIIFEFIEDESTKEHSLSAISQPDGVKFILTNFANPLGTGTIKPINFAEQSGKNLYINFYVYSVGKSNPTLHYTIYREMQGEEYGKK